MSQAVPRILIATSWFAVWAFWFVTTRSFHPTQTLALIVTTALVVAYAIAVYLHHAILLPRWRESKRVARYLLELLGMMAILTAMALAIIRTSYTQLLGPDPDPNGVYKHFAIDFVGMAVHLLAAFVIVAVASRWQRAVT